ncbi:MAG TPA: hypothetical protein P5551_04975 [Syntrophales bacterium]|jgi:hypothetical protein|nr:hypothetical protein [Syntrophales bacterium]HRT61699.1 hypothetical protein [Syntrophales bacterium]
MIGVFTHDRDRQVVAEFFELFKTPWEWGNPEKRYDALLVADDVETVPDAPVVIIYGSSTKKLDERYGLRLGSRSAPLLKWKGRLFPLYREVAVLDTPGEAILEVDGTQESAGTRVERAGRRIFRFGYDLFREVETLLLRGQPARHASIPTLDLHIDLLRESILSGDMPVVEIPPVPAGYRYAVCLTHDIDFLRFRDHLFDKTMMGFIYRASLGSVVRLLQGRMSSRNVFKNFVALATAPLVHLGLCPDFWNQIPLYMELEKNWKSTFFLIPFEGRSGAPCGPEDRSSRAARYDVAEMGDIIKTVVNEGFEVGVHGIDAWADRDCAAEERRRLEPYSRTDGIGIRMHWLYRGEDTFRILDEAGYAYDSTFGYNDAVGYRAGTVQAYKPPGVTGLLELPLNIQDTALFYPGRMNLTEKDATIACDSLMENSRRFGGALTLLWHDRSMAPERLWGDFYRDLLGKFEADGAWIGPAGKAVQWFRKRRSVVFEKVEWAGDGIEVRVKSTAGAPADDGLPGLLLRVHSRCPGEWPVRKNPEEVPLNINTVTRAHLR